MYSGNYFTYQRSSRLRIVISCVDVDGCTSIGTARLARINPVSFQSKPNQYYTTERIERTEHHKHSTEWNEWWYAMPTRLAKDLPRTQEVRHPIFHEILKFSQFLPSSTKFMNFLQPLFVFAFSPFAHSEVNFDNSDFAFIFRRKYGICEDYQYSEILALCRFCCCLFWPSAGHPCIAQQSPDFRARLKDAAGTNNVIDEFQPVPPAQFLKYFSL